MYIIGFICALVLAALVVAWIAYCMFVRERHKSEYYQYNIADIQHKHQLTGQHNSEGLAKETCAGIVFLPSRHRHGLGDEEYSSRPDYPESPAHTSPSAEKLLDAFSDNDSEGEERYYKDGIYDVDSGASAIRHSDV